MGHVLFSTIFAAMIITGVVQAQKTNSIKMVYPGQSQATAPLALLKQSTVDTTGVQLCCVRGAQVFYNAVNYAGTITVIRPAGTLETCVAVATLGPPLSYRMLGNWNFATPSLTMFTLADYGGAVVANITNPAGTRVPFKLPPAAGGAPAPIGSLVTTGTGYRYFFSTTDNFYIASTVTCIDTVASTSDNRYLVPAVNAIGLPPAILAITWTRTIDGPPPGMPKDQVALLAPCVMAFDVNGRAANNAQS